MSQSQCHEFEDRLIPVASGVADVAERQHMNAHLAQCDRCRTQFDRVRRVLGAIENQSAMSPFPTEPTIPPDFHGRLMRRLRAEEGRPAERHGSPVLESVGRWLRTQHSAWKAIAATAAAILVLFALQRVWETAARRRGTPFTERVANVPAVEVRGDQPARPAELRQAVVRSLEDFDALLRRNDILLSMREPTAGPAMPRSNAIR